MLNAIIRSINDYEETEHVGVNIGRNEGMQPDKKEEGDSTTIGGRVSGTEKEQITKATIGEGTIIVNGEETEPEGLNRDLDKTQEITKDVKTGGLDAGLTIDLRLLDPTGEGQKEIWRELTGLPQNLVTTAMYGTQAAVTMGVIAADAMVTAVDNIDGKIQITTKDETGKEVKIEVDPERGVIGQIKDKAGIALAETEFAKHNAKADEILKNPGKYTAEEVTKAEATRDAYYKEYGVSAEDYKAIVYAKQEGETYVEKDGKLAYRQGGYVEGGDKVGGTNLIGADGNIIDGKTMKEVGVHEGMHGLGYGENYAEAMGEYAADRNGLFTIFGAGYGSSGTSGNEWLNQGTVNYNGGILNLNSQPEFQSNAEYLASANQYFTEHGPSTTENATIFLMPTDQNGSPVKGYTYDDGGNKVAIPMFSKEQMEDPKGQIPPIVSIPAAMLLTGGAGALPALPSVLTNGLLGLGVLGGDATITGLYRDAKDYFNGHDVNGNYNGRTAYELGISAQLNLLGVAGGVLSGVGLYNGLAGSFGKTPLTNEELIIKAGQKAADKYVGKTGMQAGQLKHSYAESLVGRYQNIYGDRGILIEKTFNTTAGATRPDFFIQPSGTVTDLKFGQGTLSPQQQIRFPLIPGAKEIKVINIPNK